MVVSGYRTLWSCSSCSNGSPTRSGDGTPGRIAPSNKHVGECHENTEVITASDDRSIIVTTDDDGAYEKEFLAPEQEAHSQGGANGDLASAAEQMTDPTQTTAPAEHAESDKNPPTLRVEVHTGKSSEKSRLSELLNSTVVAALITALVGGFAVQWFIQRHQQAQKRDEVRAAAQRTVLETANDLLADVNHQAINLHSLTRPALDPQHAAKGARPKLEQQRQQIVEAHNVFLGEWGRRKQQIRIRISHAFNDQAAVQAWDKATEAAERLVSAATVEYERYLRNPAFFDWREDAIAEQQNVFNRAVGEFNASVEKEAVILFVPL